MNIVEFRQRIIDKLPTILPMARTVRAHQGGFDAAEFERFYDKTPALLVAWLGMQSVERLGSMLLAEHRIGVFVVVASPSLKDRDDLFLYANNELARVCANERWFEAGVRAATGLRVDNLYQGESAAGKGVSLSVVTWNQKFELASDVGELDAFKLFHSDTFPVGSTESSPHAPDDVHLEQEEP